MLNNLIRRYTDVCSDDAAATAAPKRFPAKLLAKLARR